MPARYDHTTATYRITCRDCDRTAESRTTWDRDADDLRNGGAVADTFRFHSTRGTWLNRCRECERIANRARRANAPRVPRTTSSALGINRRFGVEFECGVPSGVDRYTIQAALTAAGLSGWTCKSDCSIHISRMSGIEVVSPPLSGEEGENAIRTACRVLRNLGATVNRTCGTHVHHDANDLTVEQIQRVARGWFNNQRLIDGLVAPSRRGDNSDCSIYCRPLSEHEVELIESRTDLYGIRSLPINRYRTLNLNSYGIRGTIEIRQHQGTLDAEKVISWMRLGQAIIDTAKVEATPVATRTSVRDLLGAFGDNLNETARTFLLGRAVEFGAVAV